MKRPYRFAASAGAFGIAALTSACLQVAGEGGEGGSSRALTLDPGSLVYEPPSVRVQGHGGEGGEGG